MRQASRERGGAEIAAALRERRGEIEQATLLRVRAVSALPRAAGPEYAEGLRAAVAAGIEYGLEGIERGERSAPPVPDALLRQARLAARSGVSLDTVLRRYFAGHTLLEDFLVQEAERSGELGPAELKGLLRAQAAIVDRLLAAVSETYAQEVEHHRAPGSARRRAERIERLLGGEPLDATGLGYDLEGHHLALAASGQGAAEAIAFLAASLDAQPLTLERPEGVLWAWLGSRRGLDPAAIEGLLPEPSPGLMLAVGEPGEGIAGWRFSHRQARAALTVALRGAERLVRYAEVALLAAVLADDLLAASLRALYLTPLEEERDGGEALIETLRAYFAAERNVSSTAAALSASRTTVNSRLRAVERRIGRPVGECATELELALRVGDRLGR